MTLNFVHIQRRSSVWTDNLIDLLKQLLVDGLSGAQIADQIPGGFSRNAILGKINRLGLSVPRPIAPPPKPKPLRIRLATTHERKPPTFRSPPMAIIPTCEPVTFEQLDKTHCRYITSGEGMGVLYCGADKAPGISYCSHHASICFAGHVTLGAAEAEIRRRLMARKARAA